MSGISTVGTNIVHASAHVTPEVITPDKRLEALRERGAARDDAAPATEPTPKRRRMRKAPEGASASPSATPIPSMDRATSRLTLIAAARNSERALSVDPAARVAGFAASALINASAHAMSSTAAIGGQSNHSDPSPEALLGVATADSPPPLANRGHSEQPFHPATTQPDSYEQPSAAWSSPGNASSLSELPAVGSPLPGIKPGSSAVVVDASNSVTDPGKLLADTEAAASDTMAASEDPYSQQDSTMGSPGLHSQARGTTATSTLIDAPPTSNRPAVPAATPGVRAAVDVQPPTLTVPFHWTGGEHVVTARFQQGLSSPPMLTPSTPEVRQHLLDTPGSPSWSMDRDAGDDHRRRHEQAQDDPE